MDIVKNKWYLRDNWIQYLVELPNTKNGNLIQSIGIARDGTWYSCGNSGCDFNGWIESAKEDLIEYIRNSMNKHFDSTTKIIFKSFNVNKWYEILNSDYRIDFESTNKFKVSVLSKLVMSGESIINNGVESYETICYQNSYTLNFAVTRSEVYRPIECIVELKLNTIDFTPEILNYIENNYKESIIKINWKQKNILNSYLESLYGRKIKKYSKFTLIKENL